MDYSTLTADQIKAAMDERYANGQAYTLSIPWDVERMHDLNAKTLAFIGDTSSAKILEVCCGQGGTAAYLNESVDFTGVELSSEAVTMAQKAFPYFTFLQGDATALPFPDASFDVVIAKEAIEHLLDQAKAVSEWFRVLKPGGRLVLTTPNRDSLHLRMNRALKHPDFKCSYDHTKELTFSECCSLLNESGFTITATTGSFLMPYWGISGIDQHVRRLTDHDPEVIYWFQKLGDVCPPEFAFCMVIQATKPQRRRK
jgi:ubiquinone/menaquinone biosynthesis C-methylase UbiE